MAHLPQGLSSGWVQPGWPETGLINCRLEREDRPELRAVVLP